MDDQGSKKIIFNKSTLFSLKAELLRKQEEVNEKKQLPKHKLENFKPPPAVKKDDPKSDKEEKKSFKDSFKALDTAELEACRKSKLALEKKAELYEHLSDSAGSSQIAGRFLVDFDIKKSQNVPKQVEEEVVLTTESVSEEYSIDDEEEWTEFTDCLGRTRRCHKSDLEMFKKRDNQLLRVMAQGTSSNENVKPEVTKSPPPVKEKPLLVQKTNDYLQSLREKWEQKEQELLAKDRDIHYQDLLFDEARIHGVGYYSFSTDETERHKQMEELIKQREETLRAQKEAEQIRKKRDEMMAARVAAARARQRARAGLPPEEPKNKEIDFTACLLEFLTQQKNEAEAKATEEERKVKEEKEKERQKLREAYVREWDIGKDGVEGKVKKFREMSQDEYVDLQRNKRVKEFAPPQTSASANSNVFDGHGKMLNSDGISVSKIWTDGKSKSETSPLPLINDSQRKDQKTWADVRPIIATPPSPDIGDVNELSKKGLYFSSQKNNENNIKYRNFVKSQEPTPIIDELDGSYSKLENKNQESRNEIAPPPTYDYYGPVPKKTRSQKPFESDIREAFAQGAKSLETKSSNRKLPQHYDFTFD